MRFNSAFKGLKKLFQKGMTNYVLGIGTKKTPQQKTTGKCWKDREPIQYCGCVPAA
jgi:hypothetical protein